MPLHLPPFDPPAPSRRRFLKWSAIAAGGAVFSTCGAEAERWAFLSDTHIDADPAKVSKQGVNMAGNLRRVVSEVLAEHGKSPLQGVLVDGDCAFDEGLRGDYDTFASLIAPLREAGLSIHLTMGNHDDRGPFYAALADQKPAAPPVEGKHVGAIESPHAVWLFLDSLRFVNKVEGEFGPAQLAWLEKQLAAPGGKPVIMVGHHYPQVFRDDVIPGKEKIKISGLVDSVPFLDIARRFPRAKAYVFGHSHDWKTDTTGDGFHQINLPPTAYVFNPAKPNGWVLAALSAGGLSLELRALDPAHAQHGKTVDLKWR
jgi:3',5'-cyclic AMP phosphodiesterase CpdA